MNEKANMISIIVPTYNEQANIVAFFAQLQTAIAKTKLPYEIIFVDDNSTDGTSDILLGFKHNQNIQVLTKNGPKGKAYSLIEGFAKAKGDIFVMIDADLQYPPQAIPEMIEKIQTADVVIAERKRFEAPFIRKVTSRAFKYLFGKLFFGIDVDVQSGLKVFTKKTWQTVAFTPSSGWTFDLEFLHRAKEAGYTMINNPISFADRKKGESKVHGFHTSFELAFYALLLRIRDIRPFHIGADDSFSMKGAGMRFNKKHYITHTTIHANDSALTTFTKKQKLFFVVVLFINIVGLIWYPLATLQLFIAILSFIYFIDVFFNLYLVLKSLHDPQEVTISDEILKNLTPAELPIYSILCPLYKEAHIIPQFLNSIAKIQYPKNKLDVLLLLEEDDVDSIAAVEQMKLPAYVRTIIVPDSAPKTKPKACNYGLAFAKGKYLVIYDAEDIPDPWQLKKAYAAFQSVAPTVICLQAKLNYYNPHQNWLTRFFTAEYSLWFDITLTGLQSLGTNIPLGGTSNHFRTADLQKLKGWDPFNVTEDADLGIRLFKQGYTTAIIDSVTLEEANSDFKNWIRQRSRWIKGYMQTYLVHTRQVFTRSQNKKRHSLYFHLTIGGKIAFILINPILWLATFAYFVLYAYVGPQIEALYPTYVFYMAAISLVFGNFLFLYYYMIGCMKKQQYGLIKYVYLVPFYWLMISTAGAIALYQLIFKPHYWEKTLHGLHMKDVIKKSVPAMVVKEKEIESGIPYAKVFRGHLLRLIENRKQYLSGGFFIVGTLLANVLNYAFNAYIGRTVPLADFALISVFSSLLYIFSIPFTAFSATVSYKSGFLEGKYGSGGAYEFWKLTRKRYLVLIAIVTVLFILCSPLLQMFFHVDSVLPFIIFSPIIICGFLSGLDRGYLSGKLLFTALAIAILFEPIGKLIAAVTIIHLHMPTYIYATLTIGAVVSAIPSWFAALRTNKTKIKIDPDMNRLPKKYFISSLISGVSTIAFLTLDIILVTHFLPADQAGRYALISLLGKIIFFLGTMAAPFIGPLVSRNEGANKQSDKEFSIVFLVTAGLVGIGLVAFAGFPQVFAPLLIGDRASLIISYLPLFAIAMGSFTLSRVFVMYYQNKQIYSFGFVTFLISILQVCLFIFNHNSIDQVIEIMTLIGVLNLAVAFMLHAFIDMIVPIESNIADFFGLFAKNSFGKGRKKKNLRILIFNWRDTKHAWAGGAEVYLQQIAKRWVVSGHSVTIFCGNDGKNPRRETIDGVQIVRRGGFFTVYIWAFLYYIIRFRGTYDVIIDSENGIPFFTPLYVRKPIFTIIYHVHQEVFREHLVFPFSSIAMFLEARVMPFLYRNHKVITISNSTKEEIIRNGLKPIEHIELVTPGITIEDFFTTPKTENPSLIYVGRLKAYKNIDIAIKAFAILLAKYPSAVLTIAGEGEGGDALKKLVQKLNLLDRVRFMGRVSEKEKIMLLGESWIAIQPSQIEGWGITVIEANAAGTPVIASRVNGLKDSVVDGKTGVLIKAKNVGELVDATDKLFSNKKSLMQMSKNAYEWARMFSWNESSKKAEKIINTTFNEQSINFNEVVNPVSLNRRYSK